jgi:hypothetical protein
MAKVLAAVPVHGLDSVLTAVEQLSASAVANVEQVLNVLARLHQPSCPEPVATCLGLFMNP